MSFRNTVGVLVFLTGSWLSLQADCARSKSLPAGVMKALAADEKDYCEQLLGDAKKGCHQTFRANLLWCELVITPSGQVAILVENKNRGWCGSAGCSLSLFVQQPDKEFVEVLEELGGFAEVNVLRTVTKGHYNILKTWNHGKEHTLYRWDGVGYVAEE